MRIKIDDTDYIDKLWLNIIDYNFLSINKRNKFENIDEVATILGSNYKEYWYDKSQGLKSHEYIDSKMKTKVNFVYNDLSEREKELVWVILEFV
ncbi:MAG: hypothetical protein ACRDD7_17005 [Peptostreptococcaceae bacterium]